MDVQQQIFFHTNAINELTNRFLQHIQERDDQIASLSAERDNLAQNHSNQQATCQQEKQELQDRIDALTQENHALNERVHKLEVVAKRVSLFDTVHNESNLNSGTNMTSKNGKYTLKMQEDGNLVAYEGQDHQANHAFWASNTSGAGSAPYHLRVQADGNTVVYGKGDQALWATNTWKKGHAPYRLVLQDDRNIVLYDNSNSAVWASGTNI
jgi:predicted RNase H-like nuclease (RuvC/YqgF family)